MSPGGAGECRIIQGRNLKGCCNILNYLLFQLRNTNDYFPVNLCQKPHQCLHVSPLLWYNGLKSPLLWDQNLLCCSIKLSSIVALKFPLLCYQNLLYCGIKVSSIVGSKSLILWDQSLIYCGLKVSSIVDQSLIYCCLKISSIVGSK